MRIPSGRCRIPRRSRDLVLRADQDGLDDAGLEGHDRPQRFFVAGVGNGGGNRLQAFTRSSRWVPAPCLSSMRISGIKLLQARHLSSGARTALPRTTCRPPGWCIRSRRRSRLLCSNFCLAVMVMVISPMVTGAGKSAGSGRPGWCPGRGIVPSTVEISEPPHAVGDHHGTCRFRELRIDDGGIDVAGQNGEEFDAFRHQRRVSDAESRLRDFVEGLVDQVTLFDLLVHGSAPAIEAIESGALRHVGLGAARGSAAVAVHRPRGRDGALPAGRSPTGWLRR